MSVKQIFLKESYMFCSRLKKLRTSIGISQGELAKKLEIAPSTVGMWEQGRRMPDATMLSTIADLFKVSTDYLLCRTDFRKHFSSDMLKSLRGNVSVQEFAEKLGLNIDAYENYEEGQAIPTQTIVKYMADTCGVDYESFFEEYDSNCNFSNLYDEDITKWLNSKDNIEYVEFIYNISKQGVTKNMLSRAELKITVGKQ